MGGVTVLTASYAGAASAPAYARLAGLVADLPGEQLVRHDAGAPAIAYAAAADAIAAAETLRAAASRVPAGELLRIALHTAPTAVLAARHVDHLLAVANPGQTLLTATAAAGLELLDLGMHRLRDLGSPERIFELTSTGAQLRSLDIVPNNLPVMFTSFVGRATQVAALRTQLSGSRLVTLTGPGGSGKTRLAAQTAAQLAERWPDGVWWVELSAVTDGSQIPEAVAAAIGLLVEPGDRLLIGQLRTKQALICLDNCEQIVEGVADFVVALLSGCPEITVLATSREPLDLAGEAVWRVPALSPDEARILFLERSGTGRPGESGEVVEEAVRSICSRLDGIPLALELAAAWARTLTPGQIEAGLSDRFGLLTKNVRGVAVRQRTLAASIDWSYDLLDEDERRVFRRLAVFSGGFALDAVQAVTEQPGVLAILARLVDKSLVVAEDGRYRLLETIREYAATRLAAEDGVRDRHLDHYLQVAEAAEPLLDKDRDAWRALIEPDRENFRAALEHGLSAPNPDRGRRLAAALRWLWNLQATGHEGIGYLRRAIDRAPDDRTLLQARLLYGYATVADTVDPFGYDAAGRGLELATELGDDRLKSLFLALKAVGEFFTDFQKAWDLTAEGVRLADGIGNEHARNANLALQCVLLALWDRYDAALFSRVADGLISSGERGIATTVLTAWSESLMSTGEPRKAVEIAERALAAAEPLADFHRVGAARAQLASVLVRTGRPDEARALMQPLLELAETGSAVPNLGQVMSVISYWTGEYAAAVEWLTDATASDSPLAETFVPAMLLPTVAAAKRALGEDATELLERAADLARRYNLPRILADALDQLGRTVIAGQPDKAAELLHEALTIRVDHGLRTYLIDSLESLALLAIHTNRPTDAARLASSAAAARAEIGLGTPHDRPDLPASDGPPLPLDEAVAYARRARGTRGRPSSGWASLTPTEEQVVALAVEGLSNPEIGERLFMSRGTVKTHLAHVYTKLGVANRTELASLKKP